MGTILGDSTGIVPILINLKIPPKCILGHVQNLLVPSLWKLWQILCILNFTEDFKFEQ